MDAAPPAPGGAAGGAGALEVGGSPRLVGGRLVVSLVDLYGLDPQTGNTIWQQPRAGDFGTPVALRIGEVDVIVTPRGLVLRADDGATLADLKTAFSWTSPIVDGRTVLFAGTVHPLPGAIRASAWRLPETMQPPFQPTHLWETTLGVGDQYASPVLADGRLFVADNSGRLKVLDLATGKVAHEQGLGLNGSPVESSPVEAQHRVYLTALSGETVVLESTPPFRELARNHLPDDALRSSLVFVGSRLLVRTCRALYCLSESADRPLAAGATPAPSPPSSVPTTTGRRAALVVANDAYGRPGGLPPALAADAEAVAEALRGRGFQVIHHRNLGGTALRRSVEEFAASLSPDDVSLVYFGGHGLCMGGASQLLAVDYAGRPEQALPVPDLLALLASRTTRANIVLVDGCWRNPFGDEASQGLDFIDDLGANTILTYAAGPRQTMEASEHSALAQALARQVRRGRASSARDLISELKNDVSEATGGKYRPWHNSTLHSHLFIWPEVTGQPTGSSGQP